LLFELLTDIVSAKLSALADDFFQIAYSWAQATGWLEGESVEDAVTFRLAAVR
jgi:hypothetical protein